MIDHKIGLDMDGVISNFVGTHSNRIIEMTGKNLFPPDWKDDPPCWDYDKYFGYTDLECKAVWAEVKESSKFWKTLKPLPAMEILVKALYNSPLAHAEIYFITTRVGKHVKAQSEEWLDMWGIPDAQVLVSDRKGDLALGLGLTSFLDDKPSNVLAVEFISPNTRSYLLETPWNKAERNSVMRVTPSLQDFLKREGF